MTLKEFYTSELAKMDNSAVMEIYNDILQNRASIVYNFSMPVNLYSLLDMSEEDMRKRKKRAKEKVNAILECCKIRLGIKDGGL